MWIFTQDGFFSAVKNEFCRNDELMIQSRNKQDLINFSQVTGVKATILYNPDEDYLWRIIVKKTVLASYLAWRTQAIDYESFRDVVRDLDGDDRRAIAYSSVWAALKNS